MTRWVVRESSLLLRPRVSRYAICGLNCRRLLVLSVVPLAGDPAALPGLRAFDAGVLPLVVRYWREICHMEHHTQAGCGTLVVPQPACWSERSYRQILDGRRRVSRPSDHDTRSLSRPLTHPAMSVRAPNNFRDQSTTRPAVTLSYCVAGNPALIAETPSTPAILQIG